MNRIALLVANALLRCAGTILGAAHIVGYFAYASYYNAWSIVPGALLLIYSLCPWKWTSRVPFVVVALFVAISSYAAAGLPFLDAIHDPFAQWMFFVEFLVLVVFLGVAFALIYKKRWS